MKRTTQSKAAFLTWASKKFPAQYRRALNVSRGLGAITSAEMIASQNAFAEGKNVTGEESAIEKAFNSVIGFLSDPKFLTGVTGVYQAKQLVDINIERAKQGLPPVDNAANPQVNVGLSNNVQMILWGGLALAAVFLFTRSRD